MEILQYPDAILKTVCDPVIEFGPTLYQQLDEMWETLDQVEDSMGLAANQVGITERFFIMQALNGFRWEMINPTWEQISGYGFANQEEGCLSTPGLLSIVPDRHDGILVNAQDRNGDWQKFIAIELEAVCVQHEVDHLDGIFWFDRMPRNSRRALTRQWEKIKGNTTT